LLLVLFGLLAVAIASQPDRSGRYSTLSSSSGASKRSVIDSLALNYTWSKEGFENIMTGNFTVNNKSTHDVKDIQVTCDHFAKSGTRIDRNVRTIYDVVKAKSKKTFASSTWELFTNKPTRLLA
jgi:hypothetical protein